MASSPGQQISPWRYLTAFVGIVVILYALVLFTGGGNISPKLGIDLQGGTRVTLTARTENGGVPPRDQLIQAQQIIEQRVNGLGVSGAEVVLDGSNLTITVPGDGGDEARSLGQTAQLRFREVIGGPIPANSAAQGATQPGQPAQPGQAGQGTTGQAPAPAAPAPAPTPQSMGPDGTTQSRDVAPVSFSAPLQDPAPPPGGDGGSGGTSSPADPRVAAEVAQLRQTRQSDDPAVQQQAALALNCNAPDPLQGYDDPAKPLVACSEDRTEKYLLGPTFIEGTQIESAQAQQSSNGAGYVISLTFKPQGAETWGQYTAANVGKATAFVLDGAVVSAPRINQAIYGPTEISGQFNQERAQELAGTLRYGSLPLSFDSGEAQTVSATLGLASLEAGLIAGAIGLALVFVYCLLYYRLLGVLTILSLVLSGVVVYAVLILLGRWIGFTLDLAGVAGFIIAIGITADSFVIFFERLKDEMREGRTFRASVPRSWERARRTILTADAVSFLAAAVLYILAVGQVRGFAFTLGMSTVLDLVVVFLVTHPLVILVSKSKKLGKPSLSGLGAVARIGARHRQATAAATTVKGARA
ncbi:preprotein translocase subunit SecD [Pseudonocardia sediminis]|uniref:Protein translocase subunit SecD n=1 Tax=Pseudonocardia sediminis TaxID=1397368 RepID=A0A4Q7V0M9_PSEST|nr:protein translocase subunit SecD [Pseudonocardia sediminis]RZT86153.1 preprotein translocase subunit SecD [Pseudonocardia sediminis]